MKVIVAGHQKTGTKTLNEAFTVLGYTVYDFLENFVYYQKQWQKIANGDGNVEDFKKMYANIDVVCDMPCLLYWEEIHKAFPDSKVSSSSLTSVKFLIFLVLVNTVQDAKTLKWQNLYSCLLVWVAKYLSVVVGDNRFDY